MKQRCFCYIEISKNVGKDYCLGKAQALSVPGVLEYLASWIKA